MMKTFFVTGGAGFIGSAFVRLLLDGHSGANIVNFDALTYAGNLENLRDLDSERHVFVRGDICSPEEVLSAIPDQCDGRKYREGDAAANRK